MRVGLELESNGRVVLWRPMEGALMTIGRNLNVICVFPRKILPTFIVCCSGTERF